MLRPLLKIMANERMTLNEAISADAAYEKFYAGKIDQNAYAELMQGAENMTPYHKLILDEFLNGKINSTLLQIAGLLWKNASLETRQYLIFSAKNDADDIKKNIARFLAATQRMKSHTENSYHSRGFEVLYEDKNVKVTCTKSYTSSCKEYGASHWCTASDINGEYNGFQMFIDHTNNNDFLIQFIDKHNIEGNSYQAQFRAWRPNDIVLQNLFDWTDGDLECNETRLVNMFSGFGLNYGKIKEKYIIPNAERLAAETQENIKDEIEYYNRKERVTEKNTLNKINSTMNSQRIIDGIIERVKSLLAEHRKYDIEFAMDGKVFDISIYKNTPNYFVEVFYVGSRNGEYEYLNRKFNDSSGDAWVKSLCLCLLLDKDFKIITKIHGALTELIDNVALINDVSSDEFDYGEIVSVFMNIKNGNIIYRTNGYKPGRENNWITFTTDKAKVAINVITCSVVEEPK